MLACHLERLVELLSEGRMRIRLGEHVAITVPVEWVLLGWIDASGFYHRLVKYVSTDLNTFGYPLEGRGGVDSSPFDFLPPGALSSSFRFVPLPRPPPSFKSDIATSEPGLWNEH